jgi:hypothetical protein
VTRVVVKNAQFVDSVAAARCKPDEPVAIVVINLDNTEYQLRMTGFKNKGANSAVNESNLFVTVTPSVQLKKNDTTIVQRTVNPAGNWGTAGGQFPYTTYEFTLQLYDKAGVVLKDELDPDFDITP